VPFLGQCHLLTLFSVALLLVVIALMVPLRSALTDIGAQPVTHGT
jgi:hypothetical protein